MLLNEFDFDDIVISVKSSSVSDAVAANRYVAEKCGYPLHVGVTEAGPRRMGIIKNAAALGALLPEGIGDTVRISLTDDPVEEVLAARDILRSLSMPGHSGMDIVSCPTCGRTQIPLISLVKDFEEAAKREGLLSIPVKVAIMGCAVNGPGEASGADVGIAGGRGEMIMTSRADAAVNAVIGSAGLLPTLDIIDAGIPLALANKESLVIAGDLVMKRAADRNVRITPVDSEHSAVFQCLAAGRREDIYKIIITASGGPFFGRKRDELASVTPEMALAHPTWKMGPSITVDSATLMNKGFEVIEASKLFSLPADSIDVLIHRESIIHSLVEFRDGAQIAQLSRPDMRLCIQYAIEAPERREAVIPRLDLAAVGTIANCTKKK